MTRLSDLIFTMLKVLHIKHILKLSYIFLAMALDPIRKNSSLIYKKYEGTSPTSCLLNIRQKEPSFLQIVKTIINYRRYHNANLGW